MQKNIVTTLVKKELMQFKSLWVIPIILTIVTGGWSLFSEPMSIDAFTTLMTNAGFNLNNYIPSSVENLKYVVFYTSVQSAVAVLMYSVLTIIASLSYCIYEERQNNSYMFYQSFPITLNEYISSKIIAATISIQE